MAESDGSKTVVPHGYRGFESHSLRHRVEAARRISEKGSLR